MSSEILRRTIVDKVFKAIIIILSSLSGLPLIVILYYITRNGISCINWDFLTKVPKPVGETGGGVFNGIVGTLVLIVLSSIMAVPLGICVGIYLSETKRGRLAYTTRLFVEILQGVPSIVIGITAYVWVVVPMKGPSALAGGVALAIMMLPVIIKSTEETLNLVPDSLREAAFALGVPYYRTVLKVLLPAGLSGIVTGVLLSIARIAGETAPLLFTAFGSNFLNFNIFKPISALPLLIFNYATSPYAEWISFAWGASFLLTVLVLSLNLISKLVAKRWKVSF